MIGQPIRVKKEHIRNGCKGDYGNCPVALAIYDAFPKVTKVRADYEDIYIDDVPYETPERVERFMKRFDNTRSRESMNGFTFTLEHGAGVKFRPR